MKNLQQKSAALIGMLIIHCAVFAQGYMGVSIINKGFGATAGVVTGSTDIAFNVQRPFIDLMQPTIFSLSIGKIINLTNEESDNYSITPSFGVADSKVKRVVVAGQMNKDYNKCMSYETLETVRKFSAYYSLELGKDAYLGRVFIKGTYTDTRLFYGLGMRIFFNK